MPIPPAQRVLFLCTHNSARSQMAEGLLRHLGKDTVQVHSAGTTAAQVRPEALTVMSELGIDISEHTSKTLDTFREQAFDYVITVCDRANETCPLFPNAAQRLHWSVDDPGAFEGGLSERLELFRQARDILKSHIVEELISGYI